VAREQRPTAGIDCARFVLCSLTPPVALSFCLRWALLHASGCLRGSREILAIALLCLVAVLFGSHLYGLDLVQSLLWFCCQIIKQARILRVALTTFKMPTEAEEVAEDYRLALEDLNTNARFEISNLTVIARENTEHALAIAQTLEQHILKVGPTPAPSPHEREALEPS
jgi:hypothetical protein